MEKNCVGCGTLCGGSRGAMALGQPKTDGSQTQICMECLGRIRKTLEQVERTMEKNDLAKLQERLHATVGFFVIEGLKKLLQ
jgi:hypothetical protein